jgi:hypothetical protein
VRWHLSNRADPRAVRVADRHYSRQQPGTRQFVAPSSPLVLLTAEADALWVTQVQLAEFTDHAWPGAWVCSWFRNESPHRSSELIREAVAASRWFFGEPPAHGMVTFVDERKVAPKEVPGWCFRRAGFRSARPRRTRERSLLVLQLRPRRMPPAEAPGGAVLGLALGVPGGAR